LTPGLPKERRDIFRRAWLVRLMALVFALQTMGLFLAPARPALTAQVDMAQVDVAQVDVAEMAMPDCPHHSKQGKGHEHGTSDSCPMCQTLGCALAGAPLPDLVARADQRLIGLLAVPAPQLSPRAPPLQTPPPRGPPVLV
jgi:hypothetical protein